MESLTNYVDVIKIQLRRVAQAYARQEDIPRGKSDRHDDSLGWIRRMGLLDRELSSRRHQVSTTNQHHVESVSGPSRPSGWWIYLVCARDCRRGRREGTLERHRTVSLSRLSNLRSGIFSLRTRERDDA